MELGVQMLSPCNLDIVNITVFSMSPTAGFVTVPPIQII